ncbi:UNVERIFIED_ORG: hypothetical protein FHW05_004756 [Pantoea agglomerans]
MPEFCFWMEQDSGSRSRFNDPINNLKGRRMRPAHHLIIKYITLKTIINPYYTCGITIPFSGHLLRYRHVNV